MTETHELTPRLGKPDEAVLATPQKSTPLQSSQLMSPAWITSNVAASEQINNTGINPDRLSADVDVALLVLPASFDARKLERKSIVFPSNGDEAGKIGAHHEVRLVEGNSNQSVHVLGVGDGKASAVKVAAMFSVQNSLPDVPTEEKPVDMDALKSFVAKQERAGGMSEGTGKGKAVKGNERKSKAEKDKGKKASKKHKKTKAAEGAEGLPSAAEETKGRLDTKVREPAAPGSSPVENGKDDQMKPKQKKGKGKKRQLSDDNVQQKEAAEDRLGQLHSSHKTKKKKKSKREGVE